MFKVKVIRIKQSPSHECHGKITHMRTYQKQAFVVTVHRKICHFQYNELYGKKQRLNMTEIFYIGVLGKCTKQIIINK